VGVENGRCLGMLDYFGSKADLRVIVRFGWKADIAAIGSWSAAHVLRPLLGVGALKPAPP
jgi:hypothetical protein